MKKKILIGSIIAVVLLVLMSFSSVVGYSSVKNTQKEIITSEYDFEYCKDYLFETLVEISNNEDVNDLLNSNNQNLFSTNSNQRTFFPFRRNTNKLTVEKLDLLYNIGLKLIDRLGEEKVVELMESISIDKPEFADEVDTIIMSNDDLKERIYTLNKMNSEEVSIADFMDNPIICGILIVFSFISLIPTIVVVLPFASLSYFIKAIGLEMLGEVFRLIILPFALIIMLPIFLYFGICISPYQL